MMRDKAQCRVFAVVVDGDLFSFRAKQRYYRVQRRAESPCVHFRDHNLAGLSFKPEQVDVTRPAHSSVDYHR